jgi:hypothetical protein
VSKLGESALEIEPALLEVELRRIAPLPEAARLKGGISVRTLKRNFPDLIVRVSKRRLGMRVGDALK